MLHIDTTMEIAFEEWKQAAEHRAHELLVVFRSHDMDGDRSLNLEELSKLVHDIDAGNTALETTLEPAKEPRSGVELMAMYVHANEDDDDDDDVISEYAFVDMCFINTIGIGAVPRGRRKAATTAYHD